MNDILGMFGIGSALRGTPFDGAAAQNAAPQMMDAARQANIAAIVFAEGAANAYRPTPEQQARWAADDATRAAVEEAKRLQIDWHLMAWLAAAAFAILLRSIIR